MTEPASREAATNLGIFWAKTDREDKTDAYHPLVCHLIDVGSVAGALWEKVLSPSMRRDLARRLALPDEPSTGRWLAFLAAMHDLGKLSPCFQLQNAAALTRVRAAGFPVPAIRPASLPHGAITTATLAESLPAEIVVPSRVMDTLAAAIGGHHGVIPSDHQIEEIDEARSSSVGLGPWKAARRDLTAVIARVFGVRGSAPSRVDNATALAIAGFVSVADWIGSNSDPAFFPFAAAEASGAARVDPFVYAEESARRAAGALGRLGWSEWSATRGALTFRDLFPDIDDPRPVQQAVVDLADRLVGPSLVILEVPTGEGKTEAALYLADRWNAAAGNHGFYVALPTQATSNQMFQRVRDFLAGRFSDSTVDLQLLHGHAALSAEFAELRREGDRLYYSVSNVDGDPGADGAPAAVVASEWFTYRKRGLLAPFGVGTIDQGLLAVLQARHVFVRLFGLTHKVVLVDEVHAYDTYMSTLLCRLLEWLAALGSSVVLLSATLPRERRLDLVRAYRRGLNSHTNDALPMLALPYPRVTWLSAAGAGEVSVGVSDLARREVRCHWINADPPDEGGAFVLGDSLRAALTDGGCTAVVANTVGRAQIMYSALRRYFDGWIVDGSLELDLLHARFPFREREERETRTLARFGKPSDGNRRPFRAILVATQVIEQSLDLDFDLLVTDVAPVDLVLQRLGRVWRHRRDDRRTSIPGPTVWLGGLPLEDDWPRFRAGDERVYDPHVLLRSWLALRAIGGAVRVPEHVEALVESVYADASAPDSVTEAQRIRWEKTRRARERRIASDEEEARTRWLKPPASSVSLWQMSVDRLEEDAPGFHRAHQALTRLADPSVTLVCLFGSSGRLYLDRARTVSVDLNGTPDTAQARSLLRNSLVVSDRRVVWTLLDEAAPASWRDSALLRHCRYRAFDSDGFAQIGGHVARLDPDLGLTIRDPAGGWD